MSLQFIFGNSGSGKSYYLQQTVIKESMEHPADNYIVLVPEQFTMQTQKDMVMMHPNKGIMNIDVLSFGRLAYRVFEEVGEEGNIVLDDEGKNLILRRMASQFEGELKVLSGNLKRLGYISEVKSVISEFTQYDIREEDVEQIMEQVVPDSLLYYKLHDINLIYRGFREFLRGKYITGEELLDVLSHVVKDSKILKGSTIVLDGFTGFTPVQNRLLAELLKVCRKVMVTITLDERENPYIYKHPYQLFAMSKETVASMSQIAKEVDVTLEEPVYLCKKPVYRFKNNPAMGFLESELFRYSRKSFEEEQDCIQIHVAQNPQEESRYVAREIRRLVRTRGYRYRDLAVIVSDMDTYAEHISRECAQFHVPLFMDYKRSILLNSFVEYMRSLLDMVQQNLSYESVFRFLRSGLTDFTMAEIDLMENYVIAQGIGGKRKWQEPWILRSRHWTEESLDEVNGLRVRFVEMFTQFFGIMKQKDKTIGDITRALYAFFVSQNIQQRLSVLSREFEAQKDAALAKEYEQIYGIVIGLFDKFVELLGQEQVTTEEYCELLDAGLSEARIGIIPPSLDSVVVGDVMRTRIKDVKVLFFVGTNDTWIPGNPGSGGLLSTYDRETLEECKVRLQPGGKEQAYIQKFYLYLNLTKPTEELHLSYSRMASDGKAIRPAYLLGEIGKLFPKMHHIDESARKISQVELTPREGIPYLIEALRTKGEESDRDFAELYSWYRRNPQWAKKVEELIETMFYQRPKDKLSVQVAKELYGSTLENSVTRLERFAACAYAHFLAYGLHLEEREEYGFENRDMGNVFHAAIERYARKVEAEGQGWVELPEEKKEQFIEESLSESISGYGNTVLYSTARDEYIITRMKRQLRRTVWALTKQLAMGDFVPKGYEVVFGGHDDMESVNITLSEEESLHLRGKIDRVDECVDDDKVYVKVMDYKTGSTTFDLVAMYYGLQLQLVVYMNAAVEMKKKEHPQKEVIPAGVFYYKIQDPLVERPTGNVDVERLILEELRPDGLVYEDLNNLEHLSHDQEGKSIAIPVKYNKNGSLAKESKTARPEEFQLLGEFATQTIKNMGGRILKGEITANPYQQGDKTGCTYCGFRHVCGFDTRLPGCHYRKLEKLDKEEVMNRMRESL